MLRENVRRILSKRFGILRAIGTRLEKKKKLLYGGGKSIPFPRALFTIQNSISDDYGIILTTSIFKRLQSHTSRVYLSVDERLRSEKTF